MHLNCVVVLSPRLSLARPWQRPMAMLVFADPGAGFPVDWKTLQSLFGLTPAESRLAAGLAAGQSLEAYATASGISPMTAGAQLRAVFEKVGVHRQAELVAILQRTAQVKAPDVHRTISSSAAESSATPPSCPCRSPGRHSAWKNGVADRTEMRKRIARYRREPAILDQRQDPPIGCRILTRPSAPLTPTPPALSPPPA